MTHPLHSCPRAGPRLLGVGTYGVQYDASADLEKGVSGVKSGESLEQGFLESGGGHSPQRAGKRELSVQAMRDPAGPGPPCTATRWRLRGPSLAVNLV